MKKNYLSEMSLQPCKKAFKIQDGAFANDVLVNLQAGSDTR